MKKSLFTAALGASLLMLAASGCQVLGQRQGPADDSLLRQQEAEDRARAAELNRRPGPETGPTGLSPEGRKGLEGADVRVDETAEGVKLTLPSKILFASGSDAVQPAARKALAQAAKVIKSEFPRNHIIIQGHTDNQPIKHSAHKFKSNEDLSVARAKSVAAYLQKEGVKNHMKIDGLGETMPVADNKTAEGRAHNRRVEILIAGAGSGGGAAAPAKSRPAATRKSTSATDANDLK